MAHSKAIWRVAGEQQVALSAICSAVQFAGTTRFLIVLDAQKHHPAMELNDSQKNFN
jgi:hypothetical protein